MTQDTFKKSVYVLTAIAVVLLSYLAFVRKHSNGDSATLRNSKFLGLKSTPAVNVSVGNQKDLTLDSSTSKTDTDSKSDKETTAINASDKSAGLYTVKEGDTYGCIAENYYGSYEHWPDILNANSKYGTGFSEYELHVGAILEMPAIPATNLKPASKLCS